MKIGRAYLWVFVFFFKKGSMNPNFLHLFLFGDTKRMGGGEEVQEKKNTEREKQIAHTNTHAHTHMQKKKKKKKKGHH